MNCYLRFVRHPLWDQLSELRLQDTRIRTTFFSLLDKLTHLEFLKAPPWEAVASSNMFQRSLPLARRINRLYYLTSRHLTKA